MTSTSTAARERTRGSGRRTTVVVVALAVLLLVAIAVLTRGDATFGAPMDPRNPEHDGAQALAEVLDDHGVDVDIVRGQDALLDTDVDRDTSVVVTDPEELGQSTLARMSEHARSAGAVVVLGDARLLGQQFGLTPTSAPTGRRRARCDLPPARGLTLQARGGAGLRAEGCFGDTDSSTLVRRDDLWLMTSPLSFDNGHVLEADNAAVALRLLGQHPRVVWYVADLADTVPSDGVRLTDLLPRWVLPGLGILAAALIALVLWRGRRLGPLVIEPLPVVVRAAESTESRGRLYRRTRDRAHAAHILSAATQERLAAALALPRGSATDSVAAAVAARTGRDPRAVLDLLSPGAVSTDTALVELGRRLTDLEDEVRTP